MSQSAFFQDFIFWLVSLSTIELLLIMILSVIFPPRKKPSGDEKIKQEGL